MWDFIDKHLVPLLIAGGVLLAITLLIVAYLYRQLAGPHYKESVRALTRIVQTITGVRKAVKGDATADDELSKTITPGAVKAKDVQP